MKTQNTTGYSNFKNTVNTESQIDKNQDISNNVCIDPVTFGINSMFGRIATSYDFLNHFLSLGLDLYWRKVLVKEMLKEANATQKQQNLNVLDLATGTFDVALALYRSSLNANNLNLNIAAVDLCTPMLLAGKPKLVKQNATQHIAPLTANGVSLPLADNSMDLACISFGIRNISPREASLKEFYRVLKPGGKLCILEFGSSKKRIWGGFYNFYLNNILPTVGRVISGDKTAYKYLADSIKTFPLASELEIEMSEVGFKKIKYQSLNAGIVYLHYAYK